MKKAFTLIEVLVAMGILAIVIGMVFSMFSSGNLGWDVQNIKQDMSQQARRGIDELAKDLYQTGSGQINVTADTVIFKIPVVVTGDTDNNIYNDATQEVNFGAVNSVNDSIRYLRDSTTSQLLRQEINDSPLGVLSSRVCANNVSAITYALPTSEAITMTITCSKPLRPGSTTTISSDLQSQVTFRN